MIKRFSLDSLMRRNGGWSLIIVLAFVQMIALLGAIPGLLSIRVNAEFDEAQLRLFSILVPALIVATYLILLFISWWLTPTARKRLDGWANESTRPKTEDELLAWTEITSLSWRYGIAAVFVIFLVDILPTFLITGN